MKPIEVGCRVMVVQIRKKRGQNLLGKMGVVTEFIPPGLEVSCDGVNYRAANSRGWVVELDNSIEVLFDNQAARTIKSGAFAESSLIRIDGDVDEESECDEISKVEKCTA